MEDEQLFFEMDLEEWNHGIERYNSNFEELYPCILNARLDGAADHTQNDSEHNYLHGQNPVSSNCAVNAEVAYINDRSNLVTLPLYTAYTDDQDSLLSQNVPQDGQYLLNDDPHRSPRDPMSVDTNHNDDAEQWEIIRRNMTLVQDYVAGAEHPISPSHPEGRRFLDDFDDESGVMPSTDLDPPYNQLLYECFMATPHHEMRLSDIYEWMKSNTTKIQSPDATGWKNSIRHNLSMNSAFVQGSRSTENSSTKHMWMLTDEAIMRGGVQSTTRYRGRSARSLPHQSHARSRTSATRRGRSRLMYQNDRKSPPLPTRRRSQTPGHTTTQVPSSNTSSADRFAGGDRPPEVTSPPSLGSSLLEQSPYFPSSSMASSTLGAATGTTNDSRVNSPYPIFYPTTVNASPRFTSILPHHHTPPSVMIPYANMPQQMCYQPPASPFIHGDHMHTGYSPHQTSSYNPPQLCRHDEYPEMCAECTNDFLYQGALNIRPPLLRPLPLPVLRRHSQPLHQLPINPDSCAPPFPQWPLRHDHAF